MRMDWETPGDRDEVVTRIGQAVRRRQTLHRDRLIESVWTSLKTELVYQRRFTTKQQAIDVVFEWIEVWYNHKRRHCSLDYLSPEAFEAQRN